MEAYMIVNIQVLMQVYSNTQSYIQVCPVKKRISIELAYLQILFKNSCKYK